MTRSRTVLWYVASMAVVLFATFSEVLGAAFGIKLLFGRRQSGDRRRCRRA